jgi:hypothetical protein
MPIHKLTDATAAPDTYYLAPDKLIASNPKQTLWMRYTDADRKNLSVRSGESCRPELRERLVKFSFIFKFTTVRSKVEQNQLVRSGW